MKDNRKREERPPHLSARRILIIKRVVGGLEGGSEGVKEGCAFTAARAAQFASKVAPKTNARIV